VQKKVNKSDKKEKMRRTTRPSQVIANKDLDETLSDFSFWLKAFNLDLKPLVTLFKTPKKRSILLFVNLAWFVSIFACFVANIWIRKHELSKPKIAELLAMISELSKNLFFLKKYRDTKCFNSQTAA
jgi:hypothetical protein